ncbi:MAG: alpha/beta hydrolase [Flavobacteriales bacterium]|nr:alpha/beta hydrolase [Flavobacteriales bacterium]|tara:strand:- start:23336 stop:24097 length:762 start_codon:yes stop_codon:yes gene_type:complete
MILNSKILGNHEKKILILHGLFGSLDNWLSIAKELSKYIQVHIIDLRNHGKSFHEKNHSYELMSFDLYNYINHFKIKKPIILGHSMGGKVAMSYALNYPDGLQKLIVVDIAPKNYINNYNKLINSLIRVEKSKISSRGQGKLILEQENIDFATIQFLLKNLYRDKKQLVFRFNLRAIKNSIDELMNFDFKNYIWEGQTFFIKGGDSKYILDSDLKLINNYFSNFSLVTIDGANHWVHYDQKEKFISSIKNLIT